MKKKITLLNLLLFAVFAFSIKAQVVTPPEAFGPTPNERQMKYLNNPMAGFIHFGMNTFAGTDGIEWGNDIKRPATTFNPIGGKVDTDQWVRLLKKAGFTRVIITLKHHDGFCTWPTKFTDYNISNSSYLDGKGDLAKELSESCDKYGMDMGIYLSPWDAWEPSYGDANGGDYNDFYDGQLRELLGGNYGRLNPETGKREIVEIWLDGATGSGAAHQTYDFTRFVNTVRELQPNCLTWMTLDAAKNYSGSQSDFPVDAFWVGNEKGYVNDPVWMKVAVNGNKVDNYNPYGDYMSIPEADVSIRPGWFYHSAQDASVKSLDYLINDIYLRSVGMGIPLLLNVPPNRYGKFHENDSIALMQFGEALKNTFAKNLVTPDMLVTSSNDRGNGYEANKVSDGNYDTYWTMEDGQKTGYVLIDFGKDIEMDVIKLQEYIPLGQRVSAWKVEVEVYGAWKEFGKGKTIGYQRIIKGDLSPVRKIKLTITDAQAVPLINTIGAYRSDESIASIGTVPAGIKASTAKDLINVEAKKVSKIKFELLEYPEGSWPTISEMRFYDNSTGELKEIDRTGIISSATSEAKNYTGEPACLAANTLDNNSATIWQPEWYPNKVGMPQSLSYEFAEPVNISHLSLEARKTNKDMPTKFNIYIAENKNEEPHISLTDGVFKANVDVLHLTPILKTDWDILAEYSDLGDAIQSKVDNAVVEFSVMKNWFRLIGAKTPSTGILEIWIDGDKVATVDTYAAKKMKDQVLYEANLKGTGEHTVKVLATGRKNDKANDSKVILQQVYELEKEVKAMFELSSSFAETTEDANVFSFKIHRLGNVDNPADVTFITSPGTGVHGKTYKNKTEVVHFASGETEKELTVEIIDNTLAEGNKDFYIELNNPTGNHILGFNSTMQVLVYDNDGDASNSTLEGYCEPAGTQHADKKAFLVSAFTTGAKKNFNYTATEIPSSVYVKYLEDVIEAERNSTFTLSLIANKAGEASSSVVFQDFRYNTAHIYADWNGDLNFSTEEKIAQIGAFKPKDNILANYNQVMEIEQEITVPADAILQNIPIRVLYQNAWKELVNDACTDVTEGMVYDFRLLVKNDATSDFKPEAHQFNVFFNKGSNTIRCTGVFQVDTKINIYSQQGMLMKSVKLANQQQLVEIPVDKMGKGIYLISIVNSSVSETHKVLIS